MKYLLDTDICIYLIKQKPVSVIRRLNKLSTDSIGLSAITVFELQCGVEKSRGRQQSQRALNLFLEPIRHILSVDRPVAECAAKVRSDLGRKGAPIGPYDTLIAATALSRDLILVSNNVDEFQRVRALRLENWAT